MADRDIVLANYMLASIQKDLGFLKDNQFLDSQTYNDIVNLLPTKVNDNQQASTKPPLPTRKSTPSTGSITPPVPAPRNEMPKLPVRRVIPPPPANNNSSNNQNNNNINNTANEPSPQQQQHKPTPSPRLRPTPSPRLQPTPPMAAVPVLPRQAPAIDDTPVDAAPPPAYSQATAQPPQPPSRPAMPTVEALYDYDGDDPETDLSFRQGDIIRVTEYVNDDWWKGSLKGRTGIFPQNHVKKITKPLRPTPPKPSLSSNTKGLTSAPAPSGYPAPPQPINNYNNNNSSHQLPYSYPPPPTAMYAPPPAQASSSYAGVPPPVQQHAEEEQDKGSKFNSAGKKIGKQVGTAAVWGFGATIGSEAARAIF